MVMSEDITKTPLSMEEFKNIKTWEHAGLYIYRLVATVESLHQEKEEIKAERDELLIQYNILQGQDAIRKDFITKLIFEIKNALETDESGMPGHLGQSER
jgi:CMP-2-keto-3-deoxyoctulosonic acid synthetase